MMITEDSGGLRPSGRRRRGQPVTGPDPAQAAGPQVTVAAAAAPQSDSRPRPAGPGVTSSLTRRILAGSFGASPGRTLAAAAA